jgi:hypothetical protein
VGAGDRPAPRLLDRVRAALRARHYSRRTEDSYDHTTVRYAVDKIGALAQQDAKLRSTITRLIQGSQPVAEDQR